MVDLFFYAMSRTLTFEGLITTPVRSKLLAAKCFCDAPLWFLLVMSRPGFASMVVIAESYYQLLTTGSMMRAYSALETCSHRVFIGK